MNNSTHMPALEVSCLNVSYKKESVLFDVSVTVPQGVMLGVIGPNGAGKTTFFCAVLGLIAYSSGTISLLGSPIDGVRNNITYIPQRSSVDWDFPLTVFDMVLMGCYGKLGWFSRPSHDDHQRAYQSLDMVGLSDYAHKPIGILSGGQKQRAFLARALMSDALIYFLDEPFAGVDIATEKIIIALFKKLRDEGKTIIVIHHDLLTAPLYFDWAFLLNKTSIACGPLSEIFTSENIMRLYGSAAIAQMVSIHADQKGM
jgi:manganese/zinc/iron transport system ATP- binding protein